MSNAPLPASGGLLAHVDDYAGVAVCWRVDFMSLARREVCNGGEQVVVDERFTLIPRLPTYWR